MRRRNRTDSPSRVVAVAVTTLVLPRKARMSDRALKHRKRRPDPYAAFNYEMERAESTRRAALVAGTALTVFLVVVIAVVAVAVAGARPSSDSALTVAASVPGDFGSAVASDSVAAQITDDVAADDAVAAASELNSDTAVEAEEEPAAQAPSATKPAAKDAPPASQRFSIAIGEFGYEPTAISAKAGVPIMLTVAQGDGCAAGFLIPQLDVALDNSSGPVSADLGILQPGEYRFTCGMDMVSGLLMVR